MLQRTVPAAKATAADCLGLRRDSGVQSILRGDMFADRGLLPPLEVRCPSVTLTRTKSAVQSQMGPRRSRRGGTEFAIQRGAEER